MPDRYGGIYRHPPPPQRKQPVATFPAEVFPDPSAGHRRRQIVMAIVAAQWIWVPQPVQRPPVVTEEFVAEHVPRPPLEQRRTIREAWVPPPPPPQRFHPTAILPAEVFDNPPLDTRRRTNLDRIGASWLPGLPPPPQYPVVTEGVAPPVVFVPFSRASQHQTVLDQWVYVPEPRQRPAQHILPAEVFDNPSLGQQRRQIVNDLVVGSWRPSPPPQPRGPRVTAGEVVAVFVPYSRVQDRIIAEAWRLRPVPQPPSTRVTAGEVVAAVFVPYLRVQDRLVLESWLPGPQPRQRQPVFTESGVAVVAPAKGKGRARIRFIDRAVLVRGLTFQVPDPLVTAEGLTQVQAITPAPALPGAFAPQVTFEPFTPIEEPPPPPTRVVLSGITFQVPNVPVELTAEELLLLDFWRSRADD